MHISFNKEIEIGRTIKVPVLVSTIQYHEPMATVGCSRL